MKGLAVCTCVAANYLSFARVLADSFLRFHPQVPFYVVVGDRRDPAALFERAGVRPLRMEDLGVPGLGRMLLRYDRKQVMVAMKPAVIRYLLEQGYEAVLFLDPDMLVTAPLDPVLKAAQEHSLTLTPHVGPKMAESEDAQRERELLYTGIYNGGFVGARNSGETLRFLRWWEARLRTHCMEELKQGLHFDQRWLDLAPGYVGDLHLLRDEGVNAAYWSLAGAEVRRTVDGLTVSGRPLRLFHFSGFNPAWPELVTRHVPGLTVEQMGEAAELFRRYAALVREAGWAETVVEPWPWNGWRHQWRRVVVQWRRVRPYRPF